MFNYLVSNDSLWQVSVQPWAEKGCQLRVGLDNLLEGKHSPHI